MRLPDLTPEQELVHNRLWDEGTNYQYVRCAEDVAPPVARGRRRLDMDVEYDDTEAEIREGFYAKGRIGFTYAKEDLQIDGCFHFHTDIHGWHIEDPWSVEDGLLFSARNKEEALKKAARLLSSAWRHHKEKREFDNAVQN